MNHPDQESGEKRLPGDIVPNNDQSDLADQRTLPPPTQASTPEGATLRETHGSSENSMTEDATLPPSAMDQTAFNGSASPTIKYFGDYELLSEIARGGMGVVYKARQVNLNRLVALKMILAGQLASDEDVKRFYTEAEAAAALEHPGIVPIFEIGQHNDQHFFSMGFVDGGSLADKIKEGPLPAKDAATYTKKVAEAIAYAHNEGVIHRDLKPANILLDRNDEPKVTDFGLARRTESNSDLTRTGAVMGTPSYMPPEQAAGRTDQIGPLADVYSLGAILYCLLTGRPPFQASNPLDTLMQVMEREPVSVTTLNPAAHRDLETICHKCLQKDPAKRYASAQEFADDLGRWLSGEPIRARAVSSTERAWRWVKRHRTVSALVLATAAAVLIGSAVSVWFGLEATKEAKRAEREAVRALLSQKESDLSKEKAFRALAETEEARKKETEALELAVRNERIAKEAEKIAQQNAIQAKEAAMLAEEAEKFAKESEAKSKESEANAIRSLARSDYMLALARWNENRVSEAKQFLNRIPKEYRFFEWRLAARVFEGEELTLATPAQSFFSCVAFSPDGSLIATANLFSGQFEIWDPSNGKKRRTLGGMFNANPTPRDLKFSPDGKLLATASGTGEVEIKLWNISTGREIWSSTNQKNISIRRSLSFSPDGNQIAFGAADGEIQILDVKTGAKINGLKGHKKEPEVVLFSPDGRTLASCDQHGEIKLWQRDTGNEIDTGIGDLIDNESPIFNRCLTFSPDSRSIIARSYRDTIKIWDIATGKEGRTFLRNDKAGGSPASVAISPDGACLAVGMSDGMIFVWDISTGDEIKRFSGNESSVNSLAFSPDARRIVSGSGESRKIGRVKVWNLVSASESARVEKIDLNQITNLDTALAFSPDGERILSTAPFAMNLWDAKSGQKLWTQTNQDLWVNSICFLPNGEQFVALNGGGVTGQVALWDTATGKEIRKLTDKGIKSISLSPDGKLLSAGHWNGRIEICDSTTAENKKLLDHDGMFIRVAFYGDSKKLVSGSHDSIKLWDLQDNEEPRIFQKELPKYEVAPSIEKIIVSPDAQSILAVHHFGGDTWDAKGGFVINSFKANRLRDGSAVVFSPDGARIATGNYGDTIQLWDSQTGEEIPAVSGLGSSVRNVAFSPDGNGMAILDEDFTVKIWELESRKRKSDDELRRLAAPVPAWHRKQAESFKSAGNLYAALFHRAWLWKLNPEDPKLLEEFRATFTSYQTQSAPDASLANRSLPTVVRELLAATSEAINSEESKQ